MADRYAVFVAVVQVPPGEVGDRYLDVVQGLLHEVVGEDLVPSDFGPDPDTVADAIGAEYGTVEVVLLNPDRTPRT